MKQKFNILIIVAMMVATSSLPAIAQEETEWFEYQSQVWFTAQQAENGKWGFVDRDSRFVIEPQLGASDRNTREACCH